MSEIKPPVLVLGTYHMGNRGNQDVYKQNVEDVKEEKRQEEIREVLECLKTFRPTKIAVEYETVRADILEKEYSTYINDGQEIELEKDEIHQLGFRLAKELGHERIYPVDWNRPVGGVPLGYVYDFLKQTDQDLYDQVIDEGEEYNRKVQSLHDTKSIRDVLVALNNPDHLKKHQELYMKFALAAYDDFYVGIDWLTNYWYRRNLIIFTNVKRLVRKPEERILVIYGAGHKYLLNQFLDESSQFHVHSVTDYL